MAGSRTTSPTTTRAPSSPRPSPSSPRWVSPSASVLSAARLAFSLQPSPRPPCAPSTAHHLPNHQFAVRALQTGPETSGKLGCALCHRLRLPPRPAQPTHYPPTDADLPYGLHRSVRRLRDSSGPTQAPRRHGRAVLRRGRALRNRARAAGNGFARVYHALSRWRWGRARCGEFARTPSNQSSMGPS